MATLTRGNFLKTGAVTWQVALNGAVTLGDPIGQDGTGWVQANATAGSVVSCQGFAMATGASGDVISACREGIYQTATTLTIGGLIFLSATVGRLDDANPGAAGALVQVLGYALQATPNGLIYLNANIPVVQASVAVQGINAATTGYFGNFFIADRNYRVLGAREVHRTAGSSPVLTVEKLTSTTAKASGVNVLSTTFDGTSTASVPVWLGPSTTAANTRLVPGDRLGISDTGTLTSFADVAITVFLVAAER